METRYVVWAQLRAHREGRAAGVPEAAQGMYVCGSLAGLARPTVAIVGTRAASRAGQSLTRRISAELARAGVCIVSGLALGIDAAAHEGALDGGGITIGILGGGHGCFFPPRNRDLADRIVAANGAVCSPFQRDHPAMPHQFLERNGVVAALADAVVVVEAPARSGALNTATWAAGRIPVLVFPGDVDRRNVAGCLALIRDGATLVRDSTDILQELRIDASRLQLDARLPLFEPHDPLQAAILSTLARDILDEEQLIEQLGCDAPALFSALTELELAGAIKRREDGNFISR